MGIILCFVIIFIIGVYVGLTLNDYNYDDNDDR